MLKDRNFITNLAITTLFGGMISFLNYLFNIYLARHLVESDFGIYSAAVGIIYLIQIPVVTIQAYITQKVAKNSDFDLSNFKKKSIIYFSSIGILLALLFIFFRGYLESYIGIPQEYAYSLAFVIFASVFSPIAKGILFGLQKILAVNILMFVETLLKFSLGYIAIYYVRNLNIPILANGLPFILSGLAVLPFIKFTNNVSKNIKIDLKHLSNIFIAFLLLNSPYMLDLILVHPDVRATYSALSLTGKIVFFASTTISMTMFATISKQIKNEIKIRYLTYSCILALFIGLLISTGYIFFSNDIVKIVFHGKYLEISNYIGIYGVGMSIYAVSYLLGMYLIGEKRKYIGIILILPIVQYMLYSKDNYSLQTVTKNQLIIYLTLLSLLILLLKSKSDAKTNY